MRKLLLSIGIGLMSLASNAQLGPASCQFTTDVDGLCMERIGDYVYMGHWAGAGKNSRISIYDVSTPGTAVYVGSEDHAQGGGVGDGSVLDVETDGTYLYACSRYREEFYVLDYTNPVDLNVIGTAALPASPSSIPSAMKIDGTEAFVVDNWGKLLTIDISTPGAPVLSNSFTTGGNPTDLEISGNTAYLANSTGLVVLDITNPNAPVVLSTITDAANYYRVFIEGSYLYAASGADLYTYDISTPTAPVLQGAAVTLANAIYSFDANGTALYVGTYATSNVGAVTMMDISDPTSPVIFDEYPSDSHRGADVFYYSGFVYSLDEIWGDELCINGAMPPPPPACPIAEQTITQADFSTVCSADTIVTIGSVAGVDYYLRDDADDSVIDGPIAGTGADINLSTGALTATTTYNVYGESSSGGNTQVMDFDGVNDRLTSPNLSHDNTFTYEAWIKVNDPTPDWSGIVSATSSGFGQWTQWTLTSAGTMRLQFVGGATITTGNSPTVVNDNTWHHVAVTYDGSNVKFYVDGVLDYTYAASTTLSVNQPIFVFAERSPTQWIPGQCDEVRIWDVARTDAEIAASMNTCLTGTETDLLLYYTFDEAGDGTGSTSVVDKAGGDHPGALTNMDANTDWVAAAGPNINCVSCSAEMTDMLTITIDPIADQTLAQADFTNCGSKDTIVTVNNTQVGVNYYLRDDADNSVIDGPIAGTGASIDLNAGTVATTTTFNVNATVGGEDDFSLDFDQNAADHVNCGTSINTVLQGTNTITVESWVYVESYSSLPTVIGNYNGSMQFLLRIDGNKPTMWVGTPTFQACNAVNDIPLNTWTHIAGTYDGSNIRIYVNGVLENTVAKTGNFQANGNTVKIGESLPSEDFDGKIDNLRIWSDAKTAGDIASNMNSCLGGTEPNLIALYDFNEGTGTTLTDLTGNGHNGTLVSGPVWTAGAGVCNVCELEMTDMLTVTINALPTVNAGTDFDVCDATNNVTLSGSGANSYAWDNGVTDGVAFTGTIGTTTYTVTGTDLNGCENTDAINVTVNALPTVDAGTDQTECENTMVTLSGAGANSYAWDNGVTDGVAFTSPNGTTTYTVTGTDLNGCENTDMVDVTINDAPIVDGGVDIQLCEGLADTTLTGTGNADTYTWDNGVTDGVQFTPPNGLTTYTVTGTITATGCTNTDMVDISVGALPTVDAGLDVTQCEGPDVTLTGSGSADTYAWDNGITDAVAFTPAVDTVEYVVTGTVTATGCTNTDTVIVMVHPNPTVDAGVDMVLCTGDDTTLVGMGNADTYSWDNGVTDGVQFNNPTNGVTTYTVTGTITATGCFATDQMTIDVGNNLVFQANATATDICLGDSTQLFGTGADSYSWPAGINDMDYVSPTSTITYVVTGSTISGCMGSQNITITVNALPIVNAGADQDVCQNDQVTLSGTGADTYAWDNGVMDATPFMATTVGTTTYIVTGTDINGCMNTDTVDVNVTESPMISAVVVNENNGFDGSIDLTVTGGSGSYSYSWDHGYTDEDVFGLTTQSYTVTVDDGNCSTDSTFTIINVAGLDENGLDITVYPNPSNGIIQVIMPAQNTDNFVTIFDASGKVIQEKVENSAKFTVDLSLVEDGTYLIQVQNQSGIYNKRIVKK